MRLACKKILSAMHHAVSEKIQTQITYAILTDVCYDRRAHAIRNRQPLFYRPIKEPIHFFADHLQNNTLLGIVFSLNL